ncbi:MAG: MEKHLA domain-containing protein [Pseudanabaena sp.]|nr:MAG: MEKHLA domain-containing protein [Pseudanabaena sp.]
MDMDKSQPWQKEEIVRHSQLLMYSFKYWTQRDLILASSQQLSPLEIALSLFSADFVVVSHGTQADPVLNYGNQKALDLWQMDWSSFTSTPSRHTAEPVERHEREQLLTQAKSQGYISDYRGIRISSTGDRFYINQAIIWNVIDEDGKRWGQAATFSNWEYIESGL